MEEMLKKIIEVDEEARKIEEEAKLQMLISEQESESLKQKIYDDYIARAKDRIEKNIRVDREKAEKRWAEFSSELAVKKEALVSRYESEKDKWVDTIVDEVIG